MKTIKRKFAKILAAVITLLMTAGMIAPVTAVTAAGKYEYVFHYWSFDGDGADACCGWG